MTASSERRSSINVLDFLRLLRGYGWYSTLFTAGALMMAAAAVLALLMFAGFWWQERAMQGADDEAIATVEGVSIVQIFLASIVLPAPVVVVGAACAWLGYRLHLKRRIVALLTGEAVRGHVIDVADRSRRGGARGRPRLRVFWRSEDGRRGGSPPIGRKAAAAYEVDQEIVVYADPNDPSAGEIDVYGVRGGGAEAG